MNPRESEPSETLALRVLEWLAETDDLLGVFLGSTGMYPQQLAVAAANRETLAAVLEFVLQDDAWVLRCAERLGIAPEELVRARRFLPGGETPEWT